MINLNDKIKRNTINGRVIVILIATISLLTARSHIQIEEVQSKQKYELINDQIEEESEEEYVEEEYKEEEYKEEEYVEEEYKEPEYEEEYKEIEEYDA